MAAFSPFRVRLWDIGANRGRGSQVALITDAKDIGVSAYANEGGEMFFTLPQNHSQIDDIVPWQRHYAVDRYDIDAGAYSTIGVGLIDDYDADENEVIVYGRDYLSLFDVSISGASTSYVSQTYTTIITGQLSAAINQPTLTTGDSVTKFISMGTISSTSETTTVLTAYEPRLQFLRGIMEVMSADDSTRPILAVSRTSPFTVTWGANVGSDKEDIILRYGSTVSNFRFNPGFSDFATRAYAIGQKREGASLLFSNQTYASESTYGLIQRATTFLDVIDQTALDRRTRRFAREIGTGDKNISVRIRSGAVAPVTGWDIADSLRVKVDRGLVSLNALYTCWGWEWTGKKDGSEDLFLSLLPKRT